MQSVTQFLESLKRLLPLSLTPHVWFPSFTSLPCLFLGLGPQPLCLEFSVFSFSASDFVPPAPQVPPLLSCVAHSLLEERLALSLAHVWWCYFPSDCGASLCDMAPANLYPSQSLSGPETPFPPKVSSFQMIPGIFCCLCFSSNAFLWLESPFQTTHLLNTPASRVTSSVKLSWHARTLLPLGTHQKKTGPPGPVSAAPTRYST